MSLNTIPLFKWTEVEANVKHVGNIITFTVDDKDDIELKIWDYFCQVNKLFSDFQWWRHNVPSELFNKYCNSFYGSQALGLKAKHVQGLHRVRNRRVRRILDLPYDSHRFLMPLLLKIPSLEAQLMNRFVKSVKQYILVNTNLCPFFSDFVWKGQIAWWAEICFLLYVNRQV